MDVGRDDPGDEEEAVDEGVGIGAREEEDGKRREEEVDEGEAETGEHDGRERRSRAGFQDC